MPLRTTVREGKGVPQRFFLGGVGGAQIHTPATLPPCHFVQSGAVQCSPIQSSAVQCSPVQSGAARGPGAGLLHHSLRLASPAPPGPEGQTTD